MRSVAILPAGSYRLQASGGNLVQRLTDGAFVMVSSAEYKAWLAAGNAPLAAVQPAAPPPSGIELLGRLTDTEYVAITAAAQSALALNPPNTQLSRWIEDLRATNVVDPVAGATAKAALVAVGLLTQDRANVVFAPL